jgi:hypothetical protein
VDFVQRACTFEFTVDSGEAEETATLRLSGLSLCVIDPPSREAQYFPVGPGLVEGNPTTEKMFSDLSLFRSRATADTFFYSFFLNSWNSFIHVAATDANLEVAPAGDGGQLTSSRRGV